LAKDTVCDEMLHPFFAVRRDGGARAEAREHVAGQLAMVSIVFHDEH